MKATSIWQRQQPVSYWSRASIVAWPIRHASLRTGHRARAFRPCKPGNGMDQARTDDFRHVKVTLPLSYISSPSYRERELTNPKAKGRETQGHSSSGLSFRTIMDSQIMGKIGFNCQPVLSKIGLTMDSSHSTWFLKSVRFSRSKSSGFPWRRSCSACSIRYWSEKNPTRYS